MEYRRVPEADARILADVFMCAYHVGGRLSRWLFLLCPQDGETPLIKATKMRNIEVVELLLDKGAKVSAVDRVSGGRRRGGAGLRGLVGWVQGEHRVGAPHPASFLVGAALSQVPSRADSKGPEGTAWRRQHGVPGGGAPAPRPAPCSPR